MQDFLPTLELILKILFPIICCIGGTFLIFKGAKAEEVGQKYFFSGLGLFGYLYALTRISFLISDFTIDDPNLYPIFWRLASVISLIALLILILVLERYVVKTKYIFTILCVIGTVLTAVLQEDVARIIVVIVSGIVLIVILSIYLYIGKKSQGAPRLKALKCAISILILVFGVFIEGSFGRTLLGFDTGIIGTLIMIMDISYYFKINYSTQR
jgi:hypothetical protein